MDDQVILANLGDAVSALFLEEEETVKKLHEIRTTRKRYEKAMALINGKPLRTVKSRKK